MFVQPIKWFKKSCQGEALQTQVFLFATTPPTARHDFSRLCITVQLSLFLLICTAGLSAAQTVSKRVYTFEHPQKVYDFKPYASASMVQKVERISDTEVVVSVEFPVPARQPRGSYPLENLSPELTPYLQAGTHIQSNHPSVANIAKQLLEEANTTNLNDLVRHVLVWNMRHLRYGNPNGIHTALQALEDKVVNCIGYAHLPAAILRNLGIPCRVMRTFVVNGRYITRHYMLEVYYPEEDYWLTIEPQRASLPFPENVFLYVDTDWNQAKHTVSRAFSLDPKTTVRSGRKSSLQTLSEQGQLPKPEVQHLSHRQLMGRAVAGEGDFFVALGIRQGVQQPAGSAHRDLVSLHIYEKQRQGYRLKQTIDPMENIADENASAFRFFSSPIFLAGARSAVGYGNYESRPPAIHMHKGKIAVGLSGIRSGSGASGAEGVVQIYRQNAETWVLDQTLRLPAGSPGTIGASLLLHGEFLFLGAHNAYINKLGSAGSVYVYREEKGRYVYHSTLNASPLASQALFGYAMAADGDYLAVGAPGYFDQHQLMGHERKGVVHWFQLERGAWKERAQLTAPDGHIQDYFGFSLSILGNALAVGAPLNKGAGEHAGAVYVFKMDGGNVRGEPAVIRAENPSGKPQFGTAVLLNEHRLFVGAPNLSTELGDFSGGIYQFTYLGGNNWEAERLLTAKAQIVDQPSAMHDGRENLGFDMALSGNMLVAGAPGFYSHPYAPYNNMGGIYFFELPFREACRKMGDVNSNHELYVHPNPFLTQAEVEFSVPETARTLLVVKDERGKQVQVLLDEKLEAGQYSYRLSGLRLLPGNYMLERSFPENRQQDRQVVSILRLDGSAIEEVR